MKLPEIRFGSGHPGSATNLVCAVAGVVPIPIRAGQLYCDSTINFYGIELTDHVLKLRSNGLFPRSAARTIFHDILSEDHAIRASFIHSLFLCPDRYSWAMAINIAKPTVLF